MFCLTNVSRRNEQKFKEMIAGSWLFNIQDNIQHLIINKKIQANEIGKKFMTE